MWQLSPFKTEDLNKIINIVYANSIALEEKSALLQRQLMYFQGKIKFQYCQNGEGTSRQARRYTDNNLCFTKLTDMLIKLDS